MIRIAEEDMRRLLDELASLRDVAERFVKAIGARREGELW